MDPLKLLKSFNEVTERFELIRKNIMDNPKNIVIAKNMARKMGLSKIDIDDICKRLGGNPNELFEKLALDSIIHEAMKGPNPEVIEIFLKKIDRDYKNQIRGKRKTIMTGKVFDRGDMDITPQVQVGGWFPILAGISHVFSSVGAAIHGAIGAVVAAPPGAVAAAVHGAAGAAGHGAAAHGAAGAAAHGAAAHGAAAHGAAHGAAAHGAAAHGGHAHAAPGHLDNVHDYGQAAAGYIQYQGQAENAILNAQPEAARHAAQAAWWVAHPHAAAAYAAQHGAAGAARHGDYAAAGAVVVAPDLRPVNHALAFAGGIMAGAAVFVGGDAWLGDDNGPDQDPAPDDANQLRVAAGHHYHDEQARIEHDAQLAIQAADVAHHALPADDDEELDDEALRLRLLRRGVRPAEMALDGLRPGYGFPEGAEGGGRKTRKTRKTRKKRRKSSKKKRRKSSKKKRRNSKRRNSKR